MKKRIAVTLIGFALITGGIACGASRGPKAECISVEYVVSDGDTLWEIAEETYGKNADIRKAVREIMEINNCGGEIHPGDVLVLPAK